MHKYRYTNAKVVLLAEAAAIYISANSDDGFGHTTHWENRLLLEERSGLYDIAPSLAVSTDKIVTCAGLVSTYDIMLQIVAGYLSKAKLLTEAHGRVTFKDVAGVDEAKEELVEIVAVSYTHLTLPTIYSV